MFVSNVQKHTFVFKETLHFSISPNKHNYIQWILTWNTVFSMYTPATLYMNRTILQRHAIWDFLEIGFCWKRFFFSSSKGYIESETKCLPQRSSNQLKNNFFFFIFFYFVLSMNFDLNNRNGMFIEEGNLKSIETQCLSTHNVSLTSHKSYSLLYNSRVIL